MSRPLLYYAGSCAKCVWIADAVTKIARHRIERTPLEGDEMYEFFLRKHPAAKGYPVLLVDGKAIYGARVFAATISTVIRSWFRAA